MSKLDDYIHNLRFEVAELDMQTRSRINLSITNIEAHLNGSVVITKGRLILATVGVALLSFMLGMCV